MYRIYYKEAAITEVQKYLGVSPSGVYDEDTRIAVTEFQLINELEISGEVDRKTFDMIYFQYKRRLMNDAARDEVASLTDFPIRPGNINPFMLQIHQMMATVLSYYSLTHTLRMSSYYSDATSEAVLKLREIYMLDERDEIDEEFYLRLIGDHRSIQATKTSLPD